MNIVVDLQFLTRSWTFSDPWGTYPLEDRLTNVRTMQTEHRKLSREHKQVKRTETDGSYEVHEYERADRSVGWVLYTYAERDGVQYVKCEQEGPETWREHDWQEIVET